MEIIIKQNSRETIYEQIVSQIKLLIAKEELCVGEGLPSIRKLAQELQVSVISVQRAYEELQSEGIIESVSGKGCYVSAKVDKEFIRKEFLADIETYVKKIIEISKKNNVSKEEVKDLIGVYWEE